MVNTITWQSLAAPDFDSALRGVTRSGELFLQGSNQLGGAMKDLSYQGKERVSNEAMAKAMQIQDASVWDTFMKTQGVAGLGIRPDQATPAFMDFLKGYREDLTSYKANDLANQTTTQRLAQSNLDYGQDVQSFDFNMGRNKIEAGREDLAYNRGEETYQKNLDAEKLVQDLVRSGISGPDEALVRLNQMDLDPQTREMAVAQLGELGDVPFKIAPDVAGSGAALTSYQDVTRSLDRDERAAALEYSDNEALQLYVKGTEIESQFGDVLEPVRNKLMEMATRDGEDTVSAFSRDPGEIQNVFNDFKRDYPNAPDSVIAAAMEASLRGTGWDWFMDDELKFNKDAVNKLLKPFEDPGQLELLDSEYQAFQTSKEQRSNVRASIDRLAMEYDLHKTYGRDSEAAAVKAKMDALVRSGQASAADVSASVKENAGAKDLPSTLMGAAVGTPIPATTPAPAEIARGWGPRGAAPSPFQINTGDISFLPTQPIVARQRPAGAKQKAPGKPVKNPPTRQRQGQ